MLGKTVLLANDGRFGRAEELLSSFARKKAKTNSDFVSAAEKAIEIANLEDAENPRETQRLSRTWR